MYRSEVLKMNSFSMHYLKALVLLKLARKRKWEHSHTAFENLLRGVPSSQRGNVRSAAEELIREGFIRVKPAFYGRQVSLNENKSDELKALIRKYFGNSAV